MQLVGRLAFLVLSLLGLSTLDLNHASAEIIYSQPGGVNCAQACWTSESAGGSIVYRVYDNFTLGSSATINAVSWQGFYQDFNDPANNPVGPDSQSFEIAFYADASGAPGALISTETIVAASIDTTALGVGPSGQSNFFAFHTTVQVPFSATAGTQYWLSIVSNQATDNPVFAWSGGTGGDGTSVQEPAGSPQIVRGGDRNFALEAPEPASLALLGMGLAALGLAGRRRRHGG